MCSDAMTLEEPTAEQLKRMREEIQEDPEMIKQDLEHLRDWLNKQPHLPHHIEDTRLERFLYGCKLNVERTKRVLDTYYMVRATVPEFFKDRDPLTRDIQLSFQHIHYVPLPVLTPLGYRPTLLRLADCDVNNFDVRSLTMRIVMSLDARLLEERCLNNVMLVDLEGYTMAHFAKMSPTLAICRKALLCIQDAFPLRLAQLHLLNAPVFVNNIVNLFRPFLKKKLMQKFFFHCSGFESLYEHVPREALPREYGGTLGSVAELTGVNEDSAGFSCDSRMVKMSRRGRQSAIQEIRSWSTEHLQNFLTDHDLGECCVAIRKRDVNGEAFLTLTEGQLAFWKRDLNLATIRKLAYLVQDMNDQPEKYTQADSNIVRCGKISVDVPCDVSHIRDKQQVSSVSGTKTPPSDSWDTDFSDDDDDDDISKACNLTSTVAANVETETVYYNTVDLENEEMYCSDIVLEQPPVPVQPPALAPKPVFTTLACSNSHNLPKPPVPVQPPALAPKPVFTTLAHSNSHNLPKPPVPVESITSLVSTLQLPEHTDQCDEEDYESLDKKVPTSSKVALSALLRKSLEDRAQAVANKRPVLNAQPNKEMENVPSQGRTLVETAQHVSTFPQQTDKPHAFEGHINDGYDSEEYESINENEKSTHLPPGCGTEYYLEPVQKLQSTGGVPPLPVKQWTKPAVATLPFRKPPSPPRTKLDDAPNSPGSSGDGVAGWLGGILRIRRNQGTSSPQDSRERLPTSEVKKATTSPTSSQKLGLADQRPVAFQNTQRPLPPTPGDSKLLEKPSAVVSRRLSQQSWYHNVDRKQAEEMLRNGEDGSFLVRPSSHSQNSLTLTLWYKRRSYNISIRQRPDGRCALGTEKANEQSFASVEDLIKNYQSEKLMLYSSGEKVGRTVLTTSPPQGYQHSM